MSRFDVGEEVRYEGEVYVVSAKTADDPVRYRLLASRTGGTRHVWALESEISRMDSYRSPRDDTGNY